MPGYFSQVGLHPVSKRPCRQFFQQRTGFLEQGRTTLDRIQIQIFRQMVEKVFGQLLGPGQPDCETFPAFFTN